MLLKKRSTNVVRYDLKQLKMGQYGSHNKCSTSGLKFIKTGPKKMVKKGLN
jgi:hypothetical protein